MRADPKSNDQQKFVEHYKQLSETLIEKYFQSAENEEVRKEKLETLSALFIDLINNKIPETTHFDSNLQDLVDPAKNKTISGADLNKIKRIVMEAIFNKIYTLCPTPKPKYGDSAYPFHDYWTHEILVYLWCHRYTRETIFLLNESTFEKLGEVQ